MTGTTERLRRLAYGIWSIVGFGVLLAAFIWMASQVKIIWLPLAFAGGLVILLNPIVKALSRVAIPRVIATLFAFVVLGAFVTAIGFLVVPTIQTQSAEFGERLPTIYDDTIEFLQETGDDLGFDLGPVWTSETIQEWIQDPNNQEAIQAILGGFGSGAGRLLAGVAEVGVVVFLSPILAFYLLVDLPRTQRLAYQLIDGELVRYHWFVLDRTFTNEPVQTALLTDVDAILFRFLLPGGEWTETWPPLDASSVSPLSRPRAVEIRLTLADEGEITRIVEMAP